LFIASRYDALIVEKVGYHEVQVQLSFLQSDALTNATVQHETAFAFGLFGYDVISFIINTIPNT
jgi:hypothetical protein